MTDAKKKYVTSWDGEEPAFDPTLLELTPFDDMIKLRNAFFAETDGKEAKVLERQKFIANKA